MPDKRKDSLPADKSKKLKSSDNGDQTDTLSFDPVHFIRSHSKNNDPADIQTQVRWLQIYL